MRQLGSVLCVTALLWACSETPPPDARTATDKVVDVTVQHTVKPGPDVQIATELRDEMTPRSTGSLQVQFTEQYESGRMQVRVTPSEGLELITTISEASFEMSGADAHEWEVFFYAPEAGRHYLNFHVTVDTPFGPLTKSSAAIIKVGKNGEDGTASKSVGRIETDSEGKPVIMMQAEETISVPE